MSYEREIMYTVLLKLQMMQDNSADLTYCKANDPHKRTQNHPVALVRTSLCRIRGKFVFAFFFFI